MSYSDFFIATDIEYLLDESGNFLADENDNFLIDLVGDIELFPDRDFNELMYKNNQVHETITGEFNQFKLEGNTRSYLFNVSFVSSADMSTINDYWRQRTNIKFIFDDGVATQSIDSQIINKRKPIKFYSDNQTDKFSGTLNIREIDLITFLTDESSNILTDEGGLSLYE